VNDLVTYAGEELLCSTAHTSGTTFSLTNWRNLTGKPGQYNVMLYGAKGDGSTDDTAAWNACIQAAVTAEQASGRNQATITGPSVTYLISGSLTQGGSTKGNAQIALPVIAESSQSFELQFKFDGNAASTRYFNQPPTIQTSGGAILRSTVSGTNDGTFGEASVIGGPTPAQGFGRGTPKFSNMCVTVDGLSIILPNDPHVCGIDLAGVARANLVNTGVYVNAIGLAGITPPSQSWQFGVRMPDNDNNDFSEIGLLTMYGQFYGLIINEHTIGKSIHALFNVVAVAVSRTGDTAHGSIIQHMSIEACNVGLAGTLASFPAKVTVGLIDWEFSSWNGGDFAIINDPNSNLLGNCHVTIVNQNHLQYQPGGGNFGVRGAGNFRIFDDTRTQGDIGADTPAVPSSGSAVTNPVFNNVMVTVTGGTVSNIAVNGTAQGLTSGAFFLGPGMSITPTYSVAPTWKWTII
jgi:hypothetical protein